MFKKFFRDIGHDFSNRKRPSMHFTSIIHCNEFNNNYIIHIIIINIIYLFITLNILDYRIRTLVKCLTVSCNYKSTDCFQCPTVYTTHNRFAINAMTTKT